MSEIPMETFKGLVEAIEKSNKAIKESILDLRERIENLEKEVHTNDK